MNPADVPTIQEILEDKGIDGFLPAREFAELVDALRERENIMVVDIGPRIWIKHLDKIIEQY